MTGDRPRDQPVLSSHVVGKDLDVVTFVRNYMQFVFDDATLTAYGSVSVTTPDGETTNGMSCFADRLRGLIGKVVMTATERDDNGLELVFADASMIRISPEPSLPEVAMLQVGDGSIWAVW